MNADLIDAIRSAELHNDEARDLLLIFEHLMAGDLPSELVNDFVRNNPELSRGERLAAVARLARADEGEAA